MIILTALFVAMFVYGLVAGMYGGAILALVMAVFTVWGARQLRKRDIEYYLDPRSARVKQCPTRDALAEHDCESMRSKF